MYFAPDFTPKPLTMILLTAYLVLRIYSMITGKKVNIKKYKIWFLNYVYQAVAGVPVILGARISRTY
jgi:hypothetical protein